MQDFKDENLNPAIAHSNQLIQLRYAARELTGFPKMQAKQMLAGGHRSQFRGRGMDFDQVRLYQPGDDVRSIDWRVTARTQVPHTKVFIEERERPILISNCCCAPKIKPPTRSLIANPAHASAAAISQATTDFSR